MSEIIYQILDIYESNNLQNGVLQNIPAFLMVSIEKKANYTFIARSPNGDIAGNITGVAQPGFNHHWRIPILEQPGEWKIEINLLFEESGERIQELISICIPSKLFDYQSVDQDSREDDYLSELNMPTQEEIQYVDVTSKLVELDAHWLQIEPKLQIFRYIYIMTLKVN